MDRRDFLKNSAMAAAAVAIAPYAKAGDAISPAENKTAANAPLIDSAPMLQNYAETSIGIAFSVTDYANGYVEYGLQPDLSDAKRVKCGGYRVTDMNRTSAVRAARTAVTEAENAGRQAAADELEKKGVIMGKRWVATHDSRTRDEHLEADGQIVENNKPFVVGGEELMFPGDKSLGASGWNLYNCRCTRVSEIIGFNSDGGTEETGEY